MVFWHGLMVSMGLIVAIGAQNAYLLKQGLSKQHIAVVAGICFLGDFCLMTFGIMGAGTLFAKFPWLSLSLAIVGALAVGFDTATVDVQYAVVVFFGVHCAANQQQGDRQQ